MMIPEAPWTGVGALQQEVRSIQSELNRKADNHEIHEIRRKIDSVECECRQIRSEIDGILSRLRELEAFRINQEENP